METDKVSIGTGTLRDLDAPFTTVERRELTLQELQNLTSKRLSRVLPYLSNYSALVNILPLTGFLP